MSPTLTDWIGAGAAVATFLVALFALLFARRQILEAKAARAQAAALETERAQPYVVMYTEPSGATQLLIDLVIRNYGQTSATNVRIALDPWPQRSPDPGSAESEPVALPDVIPVLAPGQEWRTVWDSSKDRRDTDLPDRHTGQLTYEGIDHEPRTSDVVLDWSVYKTRRWVEVRSVHDAAQALRDIRSELKKWTEGARGGLAVFARDGDARDDARRAQLEALRERARGERS